MAQNRGAVMAKRARERARQEKRQSKAAKRAERRAARGERDDLAPGVDPDIAGIVPGPQPKSLDEDDQTSDEGEEEEDDG